MANEKRLIDANALIKSMREQDIKYPDVPWSTTGVERQMKNLPTVDSIPVPVMKRALAGINAADQCDQAGRSDFELRNALRVVLEWYGSPSYKEYERRTHF